MPTFSYWQKFINIIPLRLDPTQKQNPSDFTRNRKLPLRRLIVFILYLVSANKAQGVDTKSGQFFKNAKRSGLWPDAKAVHRSALSKARRKLPWHIFQELLSKAVCVAYQLWPQSSEFGWHGMSVFAIDGSKHTLPATPALRERFDPTSGLQSAGKGHYPQCLVSTLYDVFRRLPIARTIAAWNASERQEALKLLPFVPPGNLLMFDRGYPSFEFIRDLMRLYRGYFIFRCSGTSSFPAVTSFLSSNKSEDMVLIAPSLNAKKTSKERQPLVLRVIRLCHPDGTLSVLLTNLFDTRKFPAENLIALYYKRYEIEVNCRHEKVVLEVEHFHGETPNSIRQELFAAAIMTVIARTMMVIASKLHGAPRRECQLKNTIIALATEAALLAPERPQTAIAIFEELLREILRVKYYRPKVPRPSQPRVTRRNMNKWCINKTKKLHSP